MPTNANPIAALMQAIMQRNASQPMSEQPPGMPPNGMPMPTASISPQVQQMQDQMQKQAQVFGQQPNMTAGSMSGKMPMPAPMKPSDMGQTEWSTKSGRNMAITGAAIQSFSQAFQQGQQQNWQKQAAQAEQLWQTYRSLTQAMEETQDPKAKQAIQQQLQQMMSDPKTQKILKKAHSDPTSSYGVGIQRAMQQSKAEAEQQAKLEELYSKILNQQAAAEANRAKAQQESAHADLYKRQTELQGTVTDKDKFAAQTKLQQQEMIKDSSIQRAKIAAQSAAQRTNAMIEIAKIRASAMERASKAKGNDAAKFYKLQYDDLIKQINDVQKQEKDVNAEIQKRWAVQDWFGSRGDELRKKADALEQRRTQLQAAVTDLNNRVGTLTGAGIIDVPEEIDETNQPENNTQQGSGTEDDPIVVD